MKLEVVKEDLKKIAIKKGVMAFVAVALYFAASYYHDIILEEFTNVTNMYTGANNELTNKMLTYDDSEKNLKKYLDIPASKIPSKENYSLGFMRLRALIPEIDKLKPLYFFKSLDYAISDIKPNTSYGSASIEVYENTISINFSGTTDEMAFSLLSDLKQILPGYVILQSMEVIKILPVDELNVNNFLTRQDFSFITGKMELRWLISQKKSMEPQQPL